MAAGYHRSVRDRTALAGFVGAMLAAMLLGCSTVTPSASTTASAPASSDGATAQPTILAGSPAPTLPSQTDTAWGRIWDALPSSFPLAPNTRLATDTGEGPSTAVLEVPDSRDAIVQFYRAAFRDASFEIGTDGPLEDGSVTVTANDGDQCRIELSVRGVGAKESMVTVLYGAGCPFE